MFWGLAAGVVDPGDFEFEHVLNDIQSLNEWAIEGRLEVTAISLHAYPLVQDKYVILPHGASMGHGYGPIVVAREEIAPGSLHDIEIAVPGRMTTAFLALRLYLGSEFKFREVPFDEIMDEVAEGRADAGLLIHEGQLTYGQHGLHRIVDLGDWWLIETGLPLPLGINVARRDIGDGQLQELSDVLAASIEAGLDNRSEALEYAMQFGRGLDPALTDRFVGMYVNRLTQEYGDEGRQAVEELLARASREGAITQNVNIEFV
jgi:1,4-dihydroxy-6-naphthoate synthase